MWRETSLFGIFFPPLIVYALVALLLLLPLRWGLLRFRVLRWMENPAIAFLSLYLCILAALVMWL